MKVTKLLFVKRTYIISEVSSEEFNELREWLKDCDIRLSDFSTRDMFSFKDEESELLFLLRWVNDKSHAD